MNDGSPGAPSDERSRRCLQADLAPQSRTRGVTFPPAGWLTRAQPLLSFPFYCEEWWLKFPSICCKSVCISLLKDNDQCQCQRRYSCVMFSTRIVIVVQYNNLLEASWALITSWNVFLYTGKWDIALYIEAKCLCMIGQEQWVHTLYPTSQVWTLACKWEWSYCVFLPSFQKLFSLQTHLLQKEFEGELAGERKLSVMFVCESVAEGEHWYIIRK